MSLLGLRGTGPALAAASWRRRKALVGEAFGVPQRGTAYQPRVKPWGMAHNRCVLKERRIYTLVLSPVLQWQSTGTGSGEVSRSECPNGAAHTSPG